MNVRVIIHRQNNRGQLGGVPGFADVRFAGYGFVSSFLGILPSASELGGWIRTNLAGNGYPVRDGLLSINVTDSGAATFTMSLYVRCDDNSSNVAAEMRQILLNAGLFSSLEMHVAVDGHDTDCHQGAGGGSGGGGTYGGGNTYGGGTPYHTGGPGGGVIQPPVIPPVGVSGGGTGSGTGNNSGAVPQQEGWAAWLGKNAALAVVLVGAAVLLVRD